MPQYNSGTPCKSLTTENNRLVGSQNYFLLSSYYSMHSNSMHRLSTKQQTSAKSNLDSKPQTS